MALSPTKKKDIEYKSIEDVNNELIRCFNNCKNGDFKIGNALFTQSKFFVNTDLLVDRNCQNLIKKFNYSKLTHTPPYPSIKDTPVDFIDDMQIINEEIINIKQWQSKTNT